MEQRASVIRLKEELSSSKVQIADLNKIKMSKLQNEVSSSETHAKVSSSTRDDDNNPADITDEEAKRKLPKRSKYRNENGEITCDICGKLSLEFPTFCLCHLKT